MSYALSHVKKDEVSDWSVTGHLPKCPSHLFFVLMNSDNFDFYLSFSLSHLENDSFCFAILGWLTFRTVSVLRSFPLSNRYLNGIISDSLLSFNCLKCNWMSSLMFSYRWRCHFCVEVWILQFSATMSLTAFQEVFSCN